MNFPLHELYFSYSRSSGAGGQNIQKVNTKATLHWDISQSSYLTETIKNRFILLFHHHINKDGVLVINSQEHRTQKLNHEQCLIKLKEMLKQASTTPKKRVKTRPTKGSVERRLTGKKRNSDIKEGRKKIY